MRRRVFRPTPSVPPLPPLAAVAILYGRAGTWCDFQDARFGRGAAGRPASGRWKAWSARGPRGFFFVFETLAITKAIFRTSAPSSQLFSTAEFQRISRPHALTKHLSPRLCHGTSPEGETARRKGLRRPMLSPVSAGGGGAPPGSAELQAPSSSLK